MNVAWPLEENLITIWGRVLDTRVTDTGMLGELIERGRVKVGSHILVFNLSGLSDYQRCRWFLKFAKPLTVMKIQDGEVHTKQNDAPICLSLDTEVCALAPTHRRYELCELPELKENDVWYPYLMEYDPPMFGTKYQHHVREPAPTPYWSFLKRFGDARYAEQGIPEHVYQSTAPHWIQEADTGGKDRNLFWKSRYHFDAHEGDLCEYSTMSRLSRYVYRMI